MHSLGFGHSSIGHCVPLFTRFRRSFCDAFLATLFNGNSAIDECILGHTFQWKFGHSSTHCSHSSMHLSGGHVSMHSWPSRSFFDAFFRCFPPMLLKWTSSATSGDVQISATEKIHFQNMGPVEISKHRSIPQKHARLKFRNIDPLPNIDPVESSKQPTAKK